MTRKAIIILVSSCLYVTLSAQCVERVYTNTGDIYDGFISEQVPGEYISVFAEKATVTVSAKEVLDIRNDYRPFESLPEAAKEWFRENDDTLAVRLSSLELQKQYVDNALIISKNSSEVKFISFTNKTYKIPWDSVSKTTKELDFDVPYGIRDVVTLKNGERLSGGIVEQIIGESLRIRTVEGVERSVLAEDVFSVRSEMIDDNVDIWSQVLMLDRLYVEGDEAIEGFIVSRVMGQKLNILKEGTNIEQAIPLECITKYQKTWNKNYRKYDPPVIDMSRQIKVNGINADFAETLSDDKRFYVSDPSVVFVNAGEIFRIDLKNIECGKTLRAYRTESSRIFVKGDRSLFGKSFPAIRQDDDPVYETPFVKGEDGYDSCEVVLRKKGIYFLSINGLESVLVVEAK